MTTRRGAGRTIAAVSTRLESIANRWTRPALTAGVVGFISLGGSVGAHRTGRAVDGLAAALILAASVASGLARRWPAPALAVALLATAAYFGLGYPIDGPYFIPLAVTAYFSAAAGARLRAAVFAAATLALFVAAGALGHTAGPRDGLGEAVVVIAALLAGQAAAEWRARAESRAREAREEEARRGLVEERLRIARDLHDVVSHSISLINVQAGMAVHVMDERPEEARAALVAIRAVSRDALRDLRGILGLLRELDDAEPRSPAAGLEHVPALADTVRRAGVRVSVDMDAGAGLPASIDLAAYRVIQEALTNVVRHAPGAVATVTVRRVDGALRVEVDNDGRAAAAAPPAEARPGGGHGLAGMRERVRAAGGSLEAGARRGGGFSVRATLPVEGGPA
jgi:signal transduction histidine kinase